MLLSQKLAPVRLRYVLQQSTEFPLQMLWAVNLLTMALLWGLQSGMVGKGWSDMVNPMLWAAMAQTRFGEIMLAQLACATLCAIATWRVPRSGWLLAGGIGQLILQAGIGHSAMLDGWAGLSQRALQAVHLVAAAAWAGGLITFSQCLSLTSVSSLRMQAINAMMRLSRYGHLVVALTVLTGLINGLIILGVPWPWRSAYFTLLILKIMLTGILIVMALYNRYYLVPRLTADSDWVWQRFKTLTKTEIVVIVLIMLVTGFLTIRKPF